MYRRHVYDTDDAGELHNNARMGWGKAVLKWTVARHEPSGNLGSVQVGLPHEG